MPGMSRILEIESELAELYQRQEKLTVEWSSLKGIVLEQRMITLFGEEGVITLETAMKVDMEELGNRGYGSEWWGRIREFFEQQTIKGGPLDGLYQTGTSSGGQARFSVKLDQKRPLSEQQGLQVLLPYVTPIDGWRVFGIFEHTLSYGGSWCLRVREEGGIAEVWADQDFHYAHTQVGNPKIYKAEFIGTTTEALAHIYKRHPYGLEHGY